MEKRKLAQWKLAQLVRYDLEELEIESEYSEDWKICRYVMLGVKLS